MSHTLRNHFIPDLDKRAQAGAFTQNVHIPCRCVPRRDKMPGSPRKIESRSRETTEGFSDTWPPPHVPPPRTDKGSAMGEFCRDPALDFKTEKVQSGWCLPCLYFSREFIGAWLERCTKFLSALLEQQQAGTVVLLY